MRLNAGCEINFEANEPIPVILMLKPCRGLEQSILRGEYILEPNVPVMEYTDNYGNLCQRLVVPRGSFHLKMSVYAETPDEIRAKLPEFRCVCPASTHFENDTSFFRERERLKRKNKVLMML